MDKKAIILPIILSILIHTALLAVSGMIDLRDKIKPVEIFSVNIAEPLPKPEEKPVPGKEEIKTQEKTKPVQAKQEKETGIKEDEWREATIDLGSLDRKYVSYLARVKKKILRIWIYPEKAYENNEEGKVVVKLSINADGSLAGTTLLSSSGYAELDDSAMDVARAASPFEALPEIYNLSRLNIIASFHYKIAD